MDKLELMRLAIEHSREQLASGAGSYCASLVVKDGEVIGKGCNIVVQESDPTAHCEIVAMREAGTRLGTWDLSGCELYTTWEPCPLCVAAIWLARIDRVYYANLLTDSLAFGMDFEPLLREVACAGRPAFEAVRAPAGRGGLRRRRRVVEAEEARADRMTP